MCLTPGQQLGWCHPGPSCKGIYDVRLKARLAVRHRGQPSCCEHIRRNYDESNFERPSQNGVGRSCEEQDLHISNCFLGLWFSGHLRPLAASTQNNQIFMLCAETRVTYMSSDSQDLLCGHFYFIYIYIYICTFLFFDHIVLVSSYSTKVPYNIYYLAILKHHFHVNFFSCSPEYPCRVSWIWGFWLTVPKTLNEIL